MLAIPWQVICTRWQKHALNDSGFRGYGFRNYGFRVQRLKDSQFRIGSGTQIQEFVRDPPGGCRSESTQFSTLRCIG